MRDHDEVPYVVIERHSAGFGTFLWGVLIGAGAALLLAPRSGAETRDEIRDRVERARTAANDGVESAKSTVHRTRERIEDRVDSVRDQIDEIRERIEARAEDARDALETRSRSAREALDRRLDDDGSAPFVREDLGVSAAGRDHEIEIVVTEVSDEIVDGRSDLG